MNEIVYAHLRYDDPLWFRDAIESGVSLWREHVRSIRTRYERVGVRCLISSLPHFRFTTCTELPQPGLLQLLHILARVDLLHDITQTYQS